MNSPRFFKPLFTLFCGNLAAKLLGILRELLQSALWGTSLIVSSYRIAQTAVFIPINFLTSETLSAGFIPMLRRLRHENKQHARTLETAVFLLAALLSVAITITLLCKTGLLIRLLAPGFGAEGRDLSAIFVRIMALGVPFYILGTYFSCREMAGGCFFLPSIRASLQSVGLIIGLILAHTASTPACIAGGFTAAYIVFFATGLLRAFRQGWSIGNIALLRENSEVLSRFWLTIRPLLLLPFFLQGSIGIEKAIASLTGSECVAALEYAKFITESGIYMIAVPLGLVGLSMLGDYPEKDLQDWVGEKISMVLLVCIPVSFFLFGFGNPIIRLCYQRGAFDHESTLLTASILRFLGIGFWAQVGGYFLMKVLNARARNRTFIIIMLVALTVQSIISFLGYRTYGPRILGFSLSVYGLITFLAGALALHLPGKVYRIIAWMLAGGSLSLAGLGMLDNYEPAEWLRTLAFLCTWLAWIAAIPPLRKLSMQHALILSHSLRKK
ncbi:murein biosynthesis integral membrane protein MurJ [Pontiella sp.]|uniref:murein biosynthesis integral membrane protein MurJ n=1 Tax=Pontiella sp. TaxID=2837462 RepID=UPI0035679731